MISYQEARTLIKEKCQKKLLTTEEVMLSDAVSRVVSEDIYAPLSIQPFDNSAMDGFAVRHEDLMLATIDSPVVLITALQLAAGDAATEMLERNHCIHIMTGAPMPKGADAVIPIEHVDIQQNGRVRFTQAVQVGENVRYAGEDFSQGELVLQQGEEITVKHILPLSTLGIAKLKVFKKPKVAFVATGKELVNDLEQSLELGEIYNANLPYAKAFLEELPVDYLGGYILDSDDPVEFKALIEQLMAKQVDLIISSGAVSMGAFDFVRPVLIEMGADIIYHKIMMKPGKPNLFAQLPQGTLFFGLPGNPVATAVGLRFFVRYGLKIMLGMKMKMPIKARLCNEFHNKNNKLRLFLKAYVAIDGEGSAQVVLLDGQESFKVSPFLSMNAWAVIPEGSQYLLKDSLIEVHLVSDFY